MNPRSPQNIFVLFPGTEPKLPPASTISPQLHKNLPNRAIIIVHLIKQSCQWKIMLKTKEKPLVFIQVV